MSTITILSTPLLIEEGTFKAEVISLEEAKKLVSQTDVVNNFCGHMTVKAVGLEPTKTRDQCPGYEKALSLKPLGRLEFGREYSLEEVLEIGVSCMLITKL